MDHPRAAAVAAVRTVVAGPFPAAIVPAVICELTVPGQPVPKARARVPRKGGAYTPARTVAAEERIGQYLKVTYPHLKPTTRPVSVRLGFWLKGAQTMDWDNLAKLVCDALNGKAWIDDRQITGALVKVIAGSGDPRTEIVVFAL